MVGRVERLEIVLVFIFSDSVEGGEPVLARQLGVVFRAELPLGFLDHHRPREILLRLPVHRRWLLELASVDAPSSSERVGLAAVESSGSSLSAGDELAFLILGEIGSPGGVGVGGRSDLVLLEDWLPHGVLGAADEIVGHGNHGSSVLFFSLLLRDLGETTIRRVGHRVELPDHRLLGLAGQSQGVLVLVGASVGLREVVGGFGEAEGLLLLRRVDSPVRGEIQFFFEGAIVDFHGEF